MPHIRLQGISKRFGPVQALHDLSLDIAPGTHHLLVGPSGSGKSTTLRLIAGLEFPDAGSVLIDGTDVTRLPPEQRPCGWVAQSPGLIPHLTLIEQIELPLRLRGIDRHERRARAELMAERLELRPRLQHLPAALSGGEAARAALGRALILQPRLLLLDEPFAQLDPTLRRDLRRYLRELQQDLDLTLLHVTHHPADLLPSADHLSAIQAGRFIQSGRPIDIYRNPRTPWLADLGGDAPVWRCPPAQWTGRRVHLPPHAIHGTATLGLRPEQLTLAPTAPNTDTPSIGPVQIRRITPVGARTWVEVQWPDSQSLEIPLPPRAAPGQAGDPTWITWDPADTLWFELGD